MGRESRGGRKAERPMNLPKVSKIELAANNLPLRVAALCLLIVVAVAAFAYAVAGLLRFDAGERTIEYQGNHPAMSSAGELTLRYPCDTKAMFNNLTTEYSVLTEYSYRVFSPIGDFEGVNGLGALNSRPNQEVTIEPLLYEALAKLVENGNRSIFFAPLYITYQNLFSAGEDAIAKQYDPAFSEEIAAEVAALVAFSAEPSHVRIELLGENRAKLCLSEAYLAHAEACGIEAFVNLGPLQNAFVIDYIVESLVAKGYSSGGILYSYDGYCRTFAEDDAPYSVRFYDLFDKDRVYSAARLDYTGSVALAALYTFPMGDAFDGFRFYRYADGTLRHLYLDPANGLCRANYTELVMATRTGRCADVALAAYEAMVGLSDKEAAALAAEKGYTCLWAEGTTLRYVGDIFSIRALYADEKTVYAVQAVEE